MQVYCYTWEVLSIQQRIIRVSDEDNIISILSLHCNQNSIENFFSRMRNLDKDRTGLYGGGVLQQNVMNDLHASNKNGN